MAHTEEKQQMLDCRASRNHLEYLLSFLLSLQSNKWSPEWGAFRCARAYQKISDIESVGHFGLDWSPPNRDTAHQVRGENAPRT